MYAHKKTSSLIPLSRNVTRDHPSAAHELSAGVPVSTLFELPNNHRDPNYVYKETSSLAPLFHNTTRAHPARFRESSSPELPCAQPVNRVVYSAGEDDESSLMPMVPRPQAARVKLQSFFLIDDKYKLLVIRAAVEVRRFTFFENPMLDVDKVTQFLTES